MTNKIPTLKEEQMLSDLAKGVHDGRKHLSKDEWFSLHYQLITKFTYELSLEYAKHTSKQKEM